MALDGTAAAAGPADGRLAGVDVARALAIVGMVAVHVSPRPPGDDVGAWLLGVPYGKASILFALVAGVGVSVLAGRRPRHVRARLVYRTTWLLPLGLWLSVLDHPVAVILEYYAVWFLLAAAFVGVPTRWLLAGAAALLAVGSSAVAWVGVEQPTWLAVGGEDSPGGLPTVLLLTGYYPTVTWLPVVLLGMAVGRLELASRSIAARLAVGGAVAGAATYACGRLLGGPAARPGTWGHLASVEGHSEMPLAVLGAASLAVAVLGACLWLVATAPRGAASPLLAGPAAMGRGALTVYVGHLLVWHATGDWLDSSTSGEAWATVGWVALASVLAMWAWLARFDRGPLEALVRWPWRRLVAPLLDLADGRPPAGAGPSASGAEVAPGRHGVPPGES